MTDSPGVIEDDLRRFEAAWRSGQPLALEQLASPADPDRLAALVGLEMRLAWGDWKQPKEGAPAASRPALVESYLRRFPQLNQPQLVRRLIQREYLVRQSNDDNPSPDEYRRRFPELIHDEEDAQKLLSTVADGPAAVPPERAPADSPTPGRLGRYRVLEELGAGHFGAVYKGYDEELHRPVAIKVPHRHQVSRPEQVARYLIEARVLADLDHPHIVPVYDVGSSADGRCFIVSKLVEGSDLAQRIQQGLLAVVEAAALAAVVADALHYAHGKGLVHRDVKPANILLDRAGRPYLADFGLALREEDFGRGPGLVGTPYYMSPEQARGEGHRVDGRSDVFSLAVVLYQLLTGRLPFRGETQAELFNQITTVEARPPRQLNDTIPRALERVCLKALAKRASERYNTAGDLADDLRYCLEHAKGHDASREGATPAAAPPVSPSRPPSSSDVQPVPVVPKGLRSFDAHDADFFLDLLPGPRDRDGLPESIRFWKGRIEETDPDRTFAVGLLYGPSGCGKSSLVKAGLLPRLAGHVVVVYVEATADETEARLLRGLRRHFPGLPDALGLADTLAVLRRGQGLAAGHKLLLVLDQLEQWLHAHRGADNAALVQALRQCDGERVQAVLMVRDDFWMAVGRFMEELEVRVLQGENSAAVDLFDLRHAHHVLASFGRAYGVLPQGHGKLSREQELFLSQAVAGLAQDGRVICVQLALFADMVKGRPWLPATWKGAGGTVGIGVAFLEETFSSATASAGSRLHQVAARAVLKALLPEQGTDIKGHMRSRAELLEASGYAGRPADFEALLRLLDGETRLITPTEAAGEDARGEPRPAAAGAKYYQLTHDYLVPALREWLTGKQRETRRGRAELRLAERAAQWAARPERRFLPTGWEWLNIRLFTRSRDWTAAQRRMMWKAGKAHVLRGLAVLLTLLLLAAAGYEVNGRMQAKSLVEAIVNADAANVPSLAKQLRGYRRWATPRLRQYVEDYPADSREHLHASLALLPRDREQAGYLYQQMLQAPPPELRAIRDELLPRHPGLKDDLWAVLLDERLDPDPQHQARRFRAACALAAAEPDEANSQRWRDLAPFLVNRLLDAVEENPSHYLVLRDMLRPLRRQLHDPLYKVFIDEERRRPQAERSFAASLLADHADRPGEVIELALAADENQLEVLAPRLAAFKERALLACKDALTRPPDDTPKSEKEKESLARRQANAGVILLRFRQAEGVWDLLRHGTDPRVCGHLIHRLSRLDVDPRLLVERLQREKEVSIRQALLLGLGNITHPPGQGQPGWPLPAERERLLPLLWRLYEDEDAGLHGAAEWLLRKWGQQDRLAEAEKKQAAAWRPRLDQVRKQPATGGAERRPVWYVNRQGQTMVVFSGPSEFWMGSPDNEPDKIPGFETRHRVLIPRTFALAAKEVTIEQFLRWRRQHPPDFFSRTPDSPVIRISWYDAAEYCNWLSDQENIPEDQWCYPRVCKPGMTLPKDYLSRTGYRMPTGAEWEYACRAGSVTSRFYGGSEELLGDYAWYSVTAAGKRVHPVGQLKPNPWGLFDMYGNVAEWCQERFTIPYLPGWTGGIRQDVEDPAWTAGAERHGVVTRGDSVFTPPSFVRSSHRDNWQPGTQHVFLGLRPARTLP